MEEEESQKEFEIELQNELQSGEDQFGLRKVLRLGFQSRSGGSMQDANQEDGI